MSPNYDLFRRALLEGKQVVFTYSNHRREVCPHVIGQKGGREKVLTYQFAGGSSQGLPAGGEWRCLFISDVTNVELRDGPWHTGYGHSKPQTCVDQVDLEVWVDASGKPYVKRA